MTETVTASDAPKIKQITRRDFRYTGTSPAIDLWTVG